MVTNEQYTAAYKNEDYIKIMKAASKKFLKSIDRDELESLLNKALLRALEKYDESKGKFTTWLYYNVDFLCRAHLFSKRRKKTVSVVNMNVSDMELYHDFASAPSLGLDSIVENLNDEQKKLINYRFRDNMTLSEIGKIYGCTDENIRLKLNKIYEILRTENDG